MNKKILILNGSPRLKGNTAVLSEQLAAGAKESGQNFELKGKSLSLLMVYRDSYLYSSGGITVIHT